MGHLMRTPPCWIQPRFGLLRVITNLVFTSEICYYSPSVPAHQLCSSTSSLIPLCRLLTTTSSTSMTTRGSIDYFLKLDRLLQQLVRLLPTTSTTCTTTFEYFNNSYDYFLCDHDKVLHQLFWAKSALYHVEP
jgi:hypothetical protein